MGELTRLRVRLRSSAVLTPVQDGLISGGI